MNGKTILPKKELKTKTNIIEKLNIFSEEENIECKYYTNEQFKKLNPNTHGQNMTLLHLNISSLPYHIDNLTHLLKDLNSTFKLIAITESRLTTKTDPKNSVEIPNYCIEHTPTKSEKGGALLYISKELNYKNRHDLHINKDEF